MAKRIKIDLKKFRHQVAELKKAGLIKNVDARSAQPFMIRQGKTLAESVKKFDDVLSGKVQPVKLPPKKIKELGYEKATVGKQSYAMVPVSAGEKVKVEKGTVVVEEPKGIKRIKLSVPFHRLEQWAKDMKRNKKRIDKMKANNEYFAFKLFDNRSWNVYRSIDDLIDELRAYESFDYTAHQSDRKQQKYFKELEIIRVPDSSQWAVAKENEAEQTKRKKQKYNKAARKRWLKRIKGTQKDENRKKAHREAQAAYRERQKTKRRKPAKKGKRK